VFLAAWSYSREVRWLVTIITFGALIALALCQELKKAAIPSSDRSPKPGSVKGQQGRSSLRQGHRINSR
jgi:hypothetical protein